MSAPLFRVDTSSSIPVYDQLRAQVVRLAVSGTLPAGSRLPTIRQLASDLGVAKGTIARAYELLEHERVIETRGRAGTFIAEQTAHRGTADIAEELRTAADAFAVIARQNGVSDTDAMDAVRRALRDL